MMDTGEKMGPKNRQMKFVVATQLASAYKLACKKSGVPMAGELTAHMAEYIQAGKTPASQGSALRIATRRERRSSLKNIVSMLVYVRDAEEAYKSRIPQNLEGGPAYQAAESAIDMLDEAISLLDEAFG
jgi:hypothetical protein